MVSRGISAEIIRNGQRVVNLSLDSKGALGNAVGCPKTKSFCSPQTSRFAEGRFCHPPYGAAQMGVIMPDTPSYVSEEWIAQLDAQWLCVVPIANNGTFVFKLRLQWYDGGG